MIPFVLVEPEQASNNSQAALVVAAGVCVRDGALLVSRRKKGTHLEGHWEFPGGKLEPGESPEACVAREFREELGVDVRVGSIREVVYHRYPEKTVLLLFYDCDWTRGEPHALQVAEVRWVLYSDLPALNWAPADVAFVNKLSLIT